MVVNGKKYELDDFLKGLDLSKEMLVGKGNYLLTKREIEILSSNGIEYEKYSNYKDLMFIINEVIDDDFTDSDDASELEWVLENISERDYYSNTTK